MLKGPTEGGICLVMLVQEARALTNIRSFPETVSRLNR